MGSIMMTIMYHSMVTPIYWCQQEIGLERKVCDGRGYLMGFCVVTYSDRLKSLWARHGDDLFRHRVITEGPDWQQTEGIVYSF